MELVGWVCTLLVLVGYYLNSIQKYLPAMLIWSIGDIGWIAYDFSIANYSHLALSGTIILLNGYGIYRILKSKKK
jgi:hypothetical protein